MAGVSASGPFGEGNDPFEAMSQMLGQFLTAGASNSATRWDQAKQMAASIANGGESNPNVDPADRFAFEQLHRVAQLNLERVTGLVVNGDIQLVNRAQWTAATVDAYRPLFEQLADSFGAMLRSQLDEIDGDDLDQLDLSASGLNDPRQLMDMLSKMIGPMMLSMMAGSMVGQLGTRVFGSFDLPIPRPTADPVMVVAENISAFAADWSLPPDDVRLWVSLHELASHTLLSIPHVGELISDLLATHASAFTADMSALEERLGDADPFSPDGMDKIQRLLGSPDLVLGAIRSPAQEAILPPLDAIISVIGGYVDWAIDTIGSTLLSDHEHVSEALRRRRVTTDDASRFCERLFGLELTQDRFDRGDAFIAGVIERAGTGALASLWGSAGALPTPAEIVAPGLWVERLGLAQESDLPELDEPFEIPDFPDLDN